MEPVAEFWLRAELRRVLRGVYKRHDEELARDDGASLRPFKSIEIFRMHAGGTNIRFKNIR